ncbi:MAG: hypothetical protein ACRDDY_13235 [Clostridium sp.]|uniref:hypothetical protein n=1 Tax=Clostridium sp. TaxID=1506 RepID=UPI003EE5B086
MSNEFKNGDMPAMPMPTPANGGAWTAHHLSDGGYAKSQRPAFGMTKRETMAMHFMAACRSRDSDYGSWVDMALDSIKMADALLSELERTK